MVPRVRLAAFRSGTHLLLNCVISGFQGNTSISFLFILSTLLICLKFQNISFKARTKLLTWLDLCLHLVEKIFQGNFRNCWAVWLATSSEADFTTELISQVSFTLQYLTEQLPVNTVATTRPCPLMNFLVRWFEISFFILFFVSCSVQGLLLEGFQGSYGVPRTEMGSVANNASLLPAVLFLQSNPVFLHMQTHKHTFNHTSKVYRSRKCVHGG